MKLYWYFDCQLQYLDTVLTQFYRISNDGM